MYCTQCGTELINDSKYCHKCGTSIANTNQPTFSTTPKSPTTTDVAIEKNNLNGVKGWLLFLCITLTILSPLISFGQIGFEWIEFKSYFNTFPSLRTFVLIDTILNMGLIGFSIYAGYLLWSVKQNAVEIAKAYFLTRLAYGIIMPLVFMSVSDLHIDDIEIINAFIKQAVSGIIAFSIIWFTYLNRSKRVRATYSTDAVASIVPSDTSTDYKEEDTVTTTCIEKNSNYTNTENKLSHPDILASASLGTSASAPSKKKNNVLKVLGTICAAIGLLIVMAFAGEIGKIMGRSTVKNYEQGKLDATIEETLMEASQQINKQLPMMVDSETRLDTTICAGKHVLYKYTMIGLSAKDLDIISFNDEIKTMLVKNQCSNENMVKMLKFGVQYSYMYQDRDGNLITTINIDKRACGF